MLITDNHEHMFANITGSLQIGRYTTDGISRFMWSDYCTISVNDVFVQLLSKLTEEEKTTFEYILKPSVIMPTIKLLDVICGLTIRTFGYDSSVEIQVGHNVWEVYAFNRKNINYAIQTLPKEATKHCEAMSEHIETGRPITDTDAIKLRVQGKLGCNVCYKDDSPDLKLKYCSNCRLVKYCSRNCQTKDWKDHKKVCVPYKQ